MTRNLSQIRNNTVCIESCLQVIELCVKLNTQLPLAGLSAETEQNLRSSLEMSSKICQLTVQALELKSDLGVRFSLLCAELCLKLAELCETQDGKDFKACAAACFVCVRACRMLSSHPSSYVPLYSDIRLV